MAHAIIISPFSAGIHAPSDYGLKCTAKAGSTFSLRLLCHTRYGSFCGNSHRPCGLTLPKGRDPSGLPAADKTRLPSVGAAAPIRTTFRRSCPLGFAAVCRDAPSRITPLLPCCKINEMQQFQAVIPVKVFLRLVGVYNRGQHIVYDGFVLDVLPICKNIFYQPVISVFGGSIAGNTPFQQCNHTIHIRLHAFIAGRDFPVVVRAKRKASKNLF